MAEMMDAPFRKHKRLEGYDYNNRGIYFITICTLNRRRILCDIIVGRDDLGAPSSQFTITPILRLSKYGECVHKYIESIDRHYKNVFVDKYVIMPNHVHLLVRGAEDNGAPGSSRPTSALVPTIVASLKKMVNREIGHSIWQKSFYDHIIRNEADYLAKWHYIDTNPARWADDDYFTK